MARTLEKTRKQLAKKKGALNALHEGSRDSRRLRKALVRDGRLEKLAATRKKQEQPLCDRAAFFQRVVREKEVKPLETADIEAAVKIFVHQYDDELAEEQSTRRAGRPASSREDALKRKVAHLENEFRTGFLLPDLTSQDNVAALDRWEGSWAQLTSVQWVRMTDAGNLRPAIFPPNKD